MTDLWIPIVFLLAIALEFIIEALVKRRNKKSEEDGKHVPYQDDDSELPGG
jgi:hypothetical protein